MTFKCKGKGNLEVPLDAVASHKINNRKIKIYESKWQISQRYSNQPS